jgi:hypothetical protein
VAPSLHAKNVELRKHVVTCFLLQCKENQVLSLVYRHLSQCLAQFCKIYYSEWSATVVRVEEAERIRVHLLNIDRVEDDMIRTNSLVVASPLCAFMQLRTVLTIPMMV